MKLDLEYSHRPSAAAYMLRGLWPSPGLSPGQAVPPLRAVWRGYRTRRRELARFLALTGLRADGLLPLLYPHVVGFRLLMAVLTLPAYPLPLWRALQVRNHLVQHRPIPAGAELEFETRVAGQRVLDKAAEVDLHTAVRGADGLLWESLNTFYYRGRFGGSNAASPLTAGPAVGPRPAGQWQTPKGAGLRFARLTGDYNPLHWWNAAARRSGFARAFHHPQLVLGQCLARLPAGEAERPQRLDTWIKGPVYYGTAVRLRASELDGGLAFALDVEGDERPALLGRRSVPTGAQARLAP